MYGVLSGCEQAAMCFSAVWQGCMYQAICTPVQLVMAFMSSWSMCPDPRLLPVYRITYAVTLTHVPLTQCILHCMCNTPATQPTGNSSSSSSSSA
jgi:hypothetical protein